MKKLNTQQKNEVHRLVRAYLTQEGALDVCEEEVVVSISSIPLHLLVNLRRNLVSEQADINYLVDSKIDVVMSSRIENTDLFANWVQMRNNLMSSGIVYICQMVRSFRSYNEMSKIRGCGKKSLNEIKDFLGEHDLSIPYDDPPGPLEYKLVASFDDQQWMACSLGSKWDKFGIPRPFSWNALSEDRKREVAYLEEPVSLADLVARNLDQ